MPKNLNLKKVRKPVTTRHPSHIRNRLDEVATTMRMYVTDVTGCLGNYPARIKVGTIQPPPVVSDSGCPTARLIEKWSKKLRG